MTFEKGLLVAAGVVFAGLVGYKIIKKKKPALLEEGRKKAAAVREKTVEMAASAKKSFQEGYASA